MNKLLVSSLKLLNMTSDRHSIKKIKNFINNNSIILDKNTIIYFNSNITWIYSLIYVSFYLNDAQYLYLASHYFLTLHNSKEFKLEVLDEFIIIVSLLLNLFKYKNEDKSKNYIYLIKKIVSETAIKLNDYKVSTINRNLLKLGFLMISAYKIRIILFHYKHINDIVDKSVLFNIYDSLLNGSLDMLNKLKFNEYTVKNNAYEWLYIIKGLNAIKYLEYFYKNNKINDKYYIKIKKMNRYQTVKYKIKKNINTISYNKGNWSEFKNINNEMMLIVDYPILYLI